MGICLLLWLWGSLLWPCIPFIPLPQKEYKMKERQTEAQAPDLGPEHRKGKLILDEQSSAYGSDKCESASRLGGWSKCAGWGVGGVGGGAESHPQRTAFKGSYIFRICHRWAGSLLSLSASGQNLLGLRSMLAFHDPTLTSLWGSALSFSQPVLPRLCFPTYSKKVS